VNDDFGLIEGTAKLMLHFVAHLVRARQRHLGIKLDMDLDEGVETRLAGA